MALSTVDECQSRIAALVDQDESVSNISTADYSLRLRYLNMAQTEWSELYDWQALYKEYNMNISTSSGNASVVLPKDFRKEASAPKIMVDTTGYEFLVTRPQEAGQYLDTDRRVEFLGNYQDVYVLRIYGATLASGASVKVPYYASAQSLVSPTNVSMCPNPDYLVKRTIAYLWEAREDPRFPGMKSEADTILRNMLERENVFPEGSAFDRVKTTDESRYGFRMGKD